MITLEQQQSWSRRQLDALQPAVTRTMPWLDEFRERARYRLPEQPVMNRKSEQWRHTSVEKLLNTLFEPAHMGRELCLDAIPATLPSLGGPRLVFHNGNYLPHLSCLDGIPSEVEIGSLRAGLSVKRELISGYLGSIAGENGNLFKVFNDAFVDNGFLLLVPAGVHLHDAIQVIHFCKANNNPTLIQPRHLIVLEDGAKATLVEHHLGEPGSGYFHNSVTEIAVGAEADLTHYRLQNEASDSHHLSSLYIRQQTHSRYRGVTLSFGATWARTDYSATFAAPGGECDISGLYLVGDDQLSDFHLDIRHSVPNCTSREWFKGIAHGKAKAVFDGRVLVDRQAQGSDAEMRNHNLMLDRRAEINSKPTLEIYADDVKCSHGTTVGQIEAEQLFYLRSRGIDPQSATRMLCQGFVGEIIERMEPAALCANMPKAC